MPACALSRKKFYKIVKNFIEKNLIYVILIASRKRQDKK